MGRLYKMQIFSNLQRNSFSQIFIKFLLIYFINFFSSYKFFFPILIGLFFLCEEFFFALIFIIFFSYFHSINVWFLLFLLLFVKFFFIKNTKSLLSSNYQAFFNLLFLYFVLGVYFFYLGEFNFLYLIYNFAFDLMLIKVIKCEFISY